MKHIFVIAALTIGLAPSAFAETKDSTAQQVQLQVTEKGFEPSSINVKPGTAVVLNVTRKTDSTCATAIQIPSKKIKKDLPLNKTVSIELGKLEKGEIKFACGMKMLTGVIIIN
jgi:plastocyanin domain-containing protein